MTVDPLDEHRRFRAQQRGAVNEAQRLPVEQARERLRELANEERTFFEDQRRGRRGSGVDTMTARIPNFETDESRGPADEGGRPSSREVADLLGEYRQMIADAGGWASRIPPDRAAAWQARKTELLDRIEASTSQSLDARGEDGRQDDGRVADDDSDSTIERGGWSR